MQVGDAQDLGGHPQQLCWAEQVATCHAIPRHALHHVLHEGYVDLFNPWTFPQHYRSDRCVVPQCNEGQKPLHSNGYCRGRQPSQRNQR